MHIFIFQSNYALILRML